VNNLRGVGVQLITIGRMRAAWHRWKITNASRLSREATLIFETGESDTNKRLKKVLSAYRHKYDSDFPKYSNIYELFKITAARLLELSTAKNFEKSNLLKSANLSIWIESNIYGLNNNSFYYIGTLLHHYVFLRENANIKTSRNESNQTE